MLLLVWNELGTSQQYTGADETVFEVAILRSLKGGNMMASVKSTNRGFTMRLVFSALFVPLFCQSILQAQVPSRAELLEAEREAKLEEVRPPERTTIER